MVAAAAGLDFMLADLADALAPGPDRDWNGLMSLLSEPGGPLRELRKVSSQLPSGDASRALRSLVADADDALRERNRITHSLHGMVVGYTSGTIEVSSLHPRAGAWLAVPTVEELADVARRLREVAIRAGDLIPGAMTITTGSDGRLSLTPVQPDESDG